MCLSDFADQFNSALDEFQIPKNSPLEADVTKAKGILQKPIHTIEAANHALREIEDCFSGQIAVENHEFVTTISNLLNTEKNRIQRASEVIFHSQKGTITIPPSLAMLGLSIPIGGDLSEPSFGSIACTIDGRRVYVDRQSILEFILRQYNLAAEAASDDQLGKLIEALCQEVWQKTLLPERVQELARRIAIGVRLFSVQNIQPSSTIALYSVRQLVDEYRARAWSESIPIKLERGGEQRVAGYVPRGENDGQRAQYHEAEKNYLLQVVDAHNRQFAEVLEELHETDEGVIEKLNLQAKEVIAVRADIHSDLASLLAYLDVYKQQGLLDEHYRCKSGVHMVFLGDYTDRGANDVEVLSLLLSLRIENPTSVHLLRGNHEDVAIQRMYSNEGEWITEHAQELSSCYKTMPLSLCVGVLREEGKPQYVHFSHGLFSPAVDLAPLFESQHSTMVVKKEPVMQERIYPRRESKAVQKQRRAFQKIQGSPKAATEGRAIYWSDIAQQTGYSERGVGYQFSIEDIQAWAEYVGVKMLIRGHEHEFREFPVARQGKHAAEEKLLAMTMPVGSAGGGYVGLNQVDQGMIFQVEPRVRDWKKQLVVAKGEGQNVHMVFEEGALGMYEQFTSQKLPSEAEEPGPMEIG